MGRKVRFSVGLDDKWEPVAPFFKAYPSALAQVRRHVTDVDTSLNFEALKVKSVIEMVAGGMPAELDGKQGETIRQRCMTLNALDEGMQTFTQFLEATAPPMTIRQRKMLGGTKDANMEEAILWTLRDSYALHGLEEAQNLTVYEYMIARKNKYNEAVVAYNQSMAADAAMRRNG